jgi:hypothetical protein
MCAFKKYQKCRMSNMGYHRGKHTHAHTHTHTHTTHTPHTHNTHTTHTHTHTTQHTHTNTHTTHTHTNTHTTHAHTYYLLLTKSWHTCSRERPSTLNPYLPLSFSDVFSMTKYICHSWELFSDPFRSTARSFALKHTHSQNSYSNAH